MSESHVWIGIIQVTQNSGHDVYLTDDKLTAIYNWKEDSELKKNLLGVANFPNEVQFQKAIIQQFNNRMADNRMVIEKK